MRYRNNYLSNVVLRLDFPEVPALKSDQQPLFTPDIAAQYSYSGTVPIAALTFSMGIGAPGFEQQMRGWKSDYQSVANESKIFSISHDYFGLDYSNRSFQDSRAFLADFQFLYDAFSTRYQVQQFSRVGLRYINQIDIANGPALNWDNLISPKLVTSIIAGLGAQNQLLRSMHQLTARHNEMMLIFNYGIVNPDYPNPVARKQFILDYDCVVTGGVEARDIAREIASMNELCEETFEGSILDGLRELMGAIDD